MATHAGPPIFDEGDDKWEAYQVRLEAFFEAHEIVDPKKRRALLVSALSTKTVDLLAGRCAPEKIQDLTYEAAVEKLAEYYAPKGNEIAESYRFFTRNQQAGESTSDFIVELRKMAQRCNFGQALDRMLRDRIVCGLRDAGVRRSLLARSTLSLQEAEEAALAAEMAARHVQQMENGPVSDNVNALRKKQEWQKFAKRPQLGRMTKSSDNNQTGCLCCGSDSHKTAKCRFRRAECFCCRRRGHLASMCPSNPRQENVAHCEEPSSDSEDYEHFLLHLRQSSTGLVGPLWRTLQWKGVPVKMQVDTGSPVSIVTWPTYAQHRRHWPELDKSSFQLTCFLGKLPVKGQLHVPVTYAGKTVNATLVVLGCAGPNLCGRDIIQAFQLTGGPVLNMEVNNGKLPNNDEISIAAALKEEYADLFSPGLGLIKGYPVHLQLREGTVPRFCKARSVPYALRESVNEEIARLVDTGILTQVASAEWAAPLVPVVKKDGSIRLCGDFRTTVNTACHTEQYPLPRIRDIFAKLTGGEVFSTLDLKDAYNQLPIDDATKKLLVVNTPKGLHCFNRLPFGVASAPAIFQKRMEAILQGLPGVQVYLDDLVVAEKKGNCDTLRRVFQRLREAGVKLHPRKCRFRQQEVEFLGHRISAKGLKPKTENIDALLRMPRPTCVAELRALVGLVTYYNAFLGNLATVLAPLYELLKKNTPWKWQSKQEDAFEAVKRLIKDVQVLTHYDPSKALILETDASSCGIGAVLYHRVDGVNKPIGFRSRTLSAAERNYAQIEREALAVVFGVTKFREYLLGNQFTLVTDHKPLIRLFSPDKTIPPLAAARIQRWALLLGSYKYSIQYKPGKDVIVADALSRLPVQMPHDDKTRKSMLKDEREYVLLADHLDNGLVSSRDLAALTARDVMLKPVMRYIREGWPRKLPSTQEALRPLFQKKDELTCSHGIVYWGHRAVIPTAARKSMLQLLHDTHQGMTAMKNLARALFWFPGLDKEIDNIVHACSVCQQNSSMPRAEEPVPWPDTCERWSRIHVDFAGPLEGRMLLIVVDSHTKWIEVVPMKTTSANNTVEALRGIFSRFGLPRTVVSDNGPQFASRQFRQFMEDNGILHLRSPPYHPQSNGLAERAVRTVKEGLRKNVHGTLERRLSRWLLRYRRTPLRNGKTPGFMLLGFEPRSLLDNIVSRPFSTADALPRRHSAGETVWCKNYGAGTSWRPAVVQTTRGARLSTVKTEDGELCERHADQLRCRFEEQPPTPSDVEEVSAPTNEDTDPRAGFPCTSPSTSPIEEHETAPAATGVPDEHDTVTENNEPQANPLRRSTRRRKAPDRF